MQRSSFFLAGLGLVAASLSFMGCSSDSGPGGRCPGGGYSCGQRCEEANPPAGCGVDCSTTGCPIGFYCGDDELCTSDCVAGDTSCGNGTCNATGVCVPPVEDGGVVVVDNGPRPDFGPPTATSARA